MFLLSILWNIHKLRKIPFLPLAEIKREQDRRVRDIISYAYKNVPYYSRTLKSLGLEPENFMTAEDLCKLPIISKDDIQRRPSDFISQNVGKDSIWLKTSGSSGQPTAILSTKDMLANFSAISRRSRDALNLKPTYATRKARFIYQGGATEILERYHKKAIFPLGYLYYRNYRLFSIFDSPKKNFILLKKFRPNIISGFGSYVDLFFHYMAQDNLNLPDLKVVAYGGDNLRPEVRSIIEERFCPVFNTYAAVESGNIGFECESHRGYHLNIDTCAVEVVGKYDSPVSPGIKGEIVISNLINKGMVLLNYRLGDIGVMDEGNATCECGRNLPILKSLIGRSDNVIILRDGTFIHPLMIWSLFKKKINQILQYKLIQEDFDRYTLYLLPRDEFSDKTDSIESTLAEELREILGESSIKIRFVSKMPRSRGGKLCYIESYVAQRLLKSIDLE